MVKSPTHEHKLLGFERANDPLFFNENYNGNYNCDQCKKDQSGEVFHCLECEVYDECPTCAKAGSTTPLTLGETAQVLGNFVGSALKRPRASSTKEETPPPQKVPALPPTHLEVQHLSSAMIVDNNTMTLKSAVKVPIGASMISNQPWDLSTIETEPVPNAYMEVTFNKFISDGFVGVGIGNQIWVQNQMLGLQQNSYGYFNDGTVSNSFRAHDN